MKLWRTPMKVQALTQWLADRAVQPIENSLGGSIHAVYDLLLRYRVHIVAETSLRIIHNLCVLPGVKREDVKHVLSHPQVWPCLSDTLKQPLAA